MIFLSFLIPFLLFFLFFFFNDTATTEIYTLSLHDALPISLSVQLPDGDASHHQFLPPAEVRVDEQDRKSTRLNSSHGYISYAVFCLKKKKKIKKTQFTKAKKTLFKNKIPSLFQSHISCYPV